MIQSITREEVEQGVYSPSELVVVFPEDDSDDTYHDFLEVNRINLALGVLTTKESASEHGYQECAACYNPNVENGENNS